MIAMIEGKFKDMRRVCKEPTTAVKIPTVVIEADPGFGKSQIARQFGEQYFKKQVEAAREVIVFTLHAGNLEELCSSYLEFGGLLDVSPKQLNTIREMSSTDIDTLANKLDTLIEIVGEKLRELQETQHFKLRWLIIVDNLLNWQDPTKEERNVLEFLPYCDNAKMKETSWGQGRALITLQRGKGKFKDRGGEMLSIIRLEEHKLSEDKAAELLVSVADPEMEHGIVKEKLNEAGVRSVAQKLDFIPLALVTVAAFKKSMTEDYPTFSWNECLEKIKSALHVKVSHTQYRYGCLQQVTQITLRRLAEASEVLHMAFIAVGYCDNQNIPSDLIKRFIEKQVGVQDDMQMMKLKACPLLSCTSEWKGTDKTKRHTLYRMHQVTHGILQAAMLPEWAREKMEVQPLTPPHFRPLLGVALEVNEESDMTQRGFLGSHLFSLATHARKQYKEHTKDRQWREIPEVICAAVCSTNLSPVAMRTQLKYIQGCMHMSEQIADVTNTDKARYMSVKCGALAGIGKEERARKVGNEALKIMVKEDAPAKLIADSLTSLSWHYGNEIHFGISTMESHLHCVEEASGGKSTKQYAIALMQLGELWKKIDRNKGREALETAVDILSEEEDSMDYAVALGYYARFLLSSWSASDVREALRLCKRSASIMEKLVSKDTMLHIDRFSTLGRAYLTNLQPKEAIKALTPCVKKVKEFHGNPGAQWRLQQALAVSHLMRGDIDKCLHLFRENVRLQEVHDIHVSRGDRRMNKVAMMVLPVVNYLLVKPLSAVCCRLWRRKETQLAIEDEEDMEVD